MYSAACHSLPAGAVASLLSIAWPSPQCPWPGPVLCSTPSIPAADPTSQTSATIVLNAPPGVTAQYFMLKLCPQPSGTCLNRNCPDIFCNVQGLSAGAKCVGGRDGSRGWLSLVD